MSKNNGPLKEGIVVIILGVFVATIIIGSQAYAQGQSVDVEKLKQILNATGTALEANDIPGALTQLDMADQVLSGESNTTSTANMTNSTS
jgi:hypothetical protein